MRDERRVVSAGQARQDRQSVEAKLIFSTLSTVCSSRTPKVYMADISRSEGREIMPGENIQNST